MQSGIMVKKLIFVIMLFCLVFTSGAYTPEDYLQYYWTFNETLTASEGGQDLGSSANIEYEGFSRSPDTLNSSLKSQGNGYALDSVFVNSEWNNYTISFFLNVGAKDATEGYYFYWGSDTPDIKINVYDEADNDIKFQHWTPYPADNYGITLAAADYSAATWYNFVMTYDNKKLCLFKDGKQYSTCVADTGTLDDSGAAAEIAVLANIATNVFAPANSMIDDLRIYDRNLTLDEILLINNSFRPEDTNLKIQARNIFNSSIIKSFAANINGTNYNTINGWINTTILSAATGNITVFNTSLYQNRTYLNYALKGKLYAYLYPTTFFNFTFKDEQTNIKITGRNITVAVLGTYATYNTTTDTGEWFEQMIVPDNYTIRYDALPEYSRRTYIIEVKTIDNKSINLYLLNDSSTSDIVLTLIDQNLEVVESAIIQIYRYNQDLNQYVQIESLFSNFEGQSVAHLVLNEEWYKFRVLYEGREVLFTTPTIIIDTSLTLQINTETPFGLDYGIYRNVNYNLTYNNATQTVDFTFYDPSNSVTEACLQVYRIMGSSKSLNGTNCISASSGSILLSGYNFSQNFFTASGFIDLPNENDVLLASITFGEYAKIGGSNAILYYIFVQLAFLFGFAVNPIVGLVMFPVPMWGAYIMHFIHFPLYIAAATTFICFLVAWTIWDKR